MTRLDGKVAIVTGGAGGIGKETAKLFLQEGAKVLLVDLSEESLLKTKEELDNYGEIMTVSSDVSHESDTVHYVKKAIEHFGKIDIFFNNAGIEGTVAPLVEQTVENFDKVMNVNVRGVFLGLKHVLPIMMKQGSGSIINTSSVAGFMGWAGITPYVASKHAVIGLTKNAALEAASANVRVNSIHPSPVNTRMMRFVEEGTSPGAAEVAKAAITKDIPLGRYGETSDIAKLVLFLASDESSFITGSQYRIDGGIGAK
ncbi:SDR family oxidoreductase [Mesobacillus maritimus]|uniref:SDR family NAD(P)-dependent oxidoreductase n=1 Tax=Mesobacillus maritimus TaxID=1643336 RepID=UPI00203F0A1A|nr:SDR family NAD(P)-dependent oxidoreductase [Mesobacillus maritimus]MCM3588381.1 SDR family oxidoreductase [Mesobacillus maritimus]